MSIILWDLIVHKSLLRSHVMLFVVAEKIANIPALENNNIPKKRASIINSFFLCNLFISMINP